MAEFDFSIKYRPGKENVDADCLSRKPLELSELKRKCTESMEPAGVAAVLVARKDGLGDAWVSVVNHIDVSICELVAPAGEVIVPMADGELAREQEIDEVVGPVRKLVLLGSKPKQSE